MENLEVNTLFWRSKRVLLTGHTGFKGSWLSLWLQQLGADVSGFSLEPSSDPNLFTSAGVVKGMESFRGDVRDLQAVTGVLARQRPEIVIHMAAQSLVRKSYSEPVETYATNVMGTVNLLEAARRSSDVRAMLIVTSDKCYENREQLHGYREIDPMGGFDPYSSSKGCAELVTAAYRRSFFKAGTGVASARAGNVIGGGDWADDRLIPDIMRAFLKGAAVHIRNPYAVRPWQHVLDPLGGYLTLIERLWERGEEFSEGWNFGPGKADAWPVAQVATWLVQCWGGGAQWISDGEVHPHEAGLLTLDCEKACRRLDWRPALDVSTALEWVVEWYRAFAQGDDMRRITLGQIERFQNLMDRAA